MPRQEVEVPGGGGGASASPVQVVPLHVVVLEHPLQLDVLADEAGRQQAVDPQLEALLHGERHAL